MKVGVISGFYPGRRFNSHVNHAAYCMQHGYYYIDASFPCFDRRRYFRKLEVISMYLSLFDWIFWIDDDAYFTDYRRPLEDFIGMLEHNEQMLICRSPSSKTLFTRFSAGQFFLRNSPAAHEFLSTAKDVDLRWVKESFWSDELGFFSAGDQDAMVYLSLTDPRFRDGFLKIVDHNHFNNRPFEFVARPEEHFIVHFTGRSKLKEMHDFRTRLGMNEYLLPHNVLEELAIEGRRTWLGALGRFLRRGPQRLKAAVMGRAHFRPQD